LEPTIRAITCPHCKNILFALELDVKNSAATWNMTKDSPTVQNDAQGHFMKCGNCAKRVAVEKVSAPGVDTWRVAASSK